MSTTHDLQFNPLENFGDIRRVSASLFAGFLLVISSTWVLGWGFMVWDQGPSLQVLMVEVLLGLYLGGIVAGLFGLFIYGAFEWVLQGLNVIFRAERTPAARASPRVSWSG